MADALLVLNAGSSSLKFSVFLNEDPLQRFVYGQIDGLGTLPRFAVHSAGRLLAEKTWPSSGLARHQEAIEFLLEWGRTGVLADHRLVAVGHWIVHGGVRFTGPVLVDQTVLAALFDLVPLAPLHQPHNLAAVHAVAQLAPGVVQVACFDTAFHRTQPAVAQTFALPRRYGAEAVRRYGFHGLSCEYIASLLPDIDPRAASGRTVVAHLGSGASLCAMQNGRSVATTMGFTALDGLVMGTRCGAIDPGVLLYLMDKHGLGKDALQQLLYEQSGLLGVSAVSSDMRVLLSSPDPHAVEAINLFVYRIARELGSLAAALGGIDALVFTGGIGENAAAIRGRVCAAARWLGVHVDEVANARGAGRITRADSPVSAWVVPTDEERAIAQHTRRLLEAVVSTAGRSTHDGLH